MPSTSQPGDTKVDCIPLWFTCRMCTITGTGETPVLTSGAARLSSELPTPSSKLPFNTSKLVICRMIAATLRGVAG